MLILDIALTLICWEYYHSVNIFALHFLRIFVKHLPQLTNKCLANIYEISVRKCHLGNICKMFVEHTCLTIGFNVQMLSTCLKEMFDKHLT